MSLGIKIELNCHMRTIVQLANTVLWYNIPSLYIYLLIQYSSCRWDNWMNQTLPHHVLLVFTGNCTIQVSCQTSCRLCCVAWILCEWAHVVVFSIPLTPPPLYVNLTGDVHNGVLEVWQVMYVCSHPVNKQFPMVCVDSPGAIFALICALENI